MNLSVDFYNLVQILIEPGWILMDHTLTVSFWIMRFLILTFYSPSNSRKA